MKRYEMHCHTWNSRCSWNKPAEILKRCKQIGLDGICIVDHDSLKGALEVEALNKDKDFEVIKGTEFTTNEGDIIGLFLNEEILFDKKNGDVQWLIDEIHHQNGIVVLPHPFAFFRRSNALFYDIDVIEGYNARNMLMSENNKAVAAALCLGLPITAGSDAHFPFEIGIYSVWCNNLREDLLYNNLKIELGTRKRFRAHILTVILKQLRRFIK